MKGLVVFILLLNVIVVWCYGAMPVKQIQRASGEAAAMINPMADSILKLSGELL